MAQTANYGLYVIGTSEDPLVKTWIEKISGESNSNMTIIDEALVAMDSKVAGILKDVQDISSISTIYDSASALPPLSAADDGTKYCAFTEGSLPIVLYGWNGNNLSWEMIDQIRGSSIYIVLDEGTTYRFESTSPYFYLVGQVDREFVEVDPTVPGWAKQPNKPTYTADEVGALPATVVVPTKISQLSNDSDFVTVSYVDALLGNINTLLDEINGEVI